MGTIFGSRHWHPIFNLLRLETTDGTLMVTKFPSSLSGCIASHPFHLPPCSSLPYFGPRLWASAGFEGMVQDLRGVRVCVCCRVWHCRGSSVGVGPFSAEQLYSFLCGRMMRMAHFGSNQSIPLSEAPSYCYNGNGSVLTLRPQLLFSAFGHMWMDRSIPMPTSFTTFQKDSIPVMGSYVFQRSPNRSRPPRQSLLDEFRMVLADVFSVASLPLGGSLIAL
ncbi:hypothetical protein U1Q18_001920 [Sarracenia purpurea var. burkii]